MTMNEFLFDCYLEILFQWIKHQLPASFQESEDAWDHTLIEESDQYRVRVSFYHTGIIEEVIEDLQTQTAIYYIHFNLDFFHKAVRMLKEFLDFYAHLNDPQKRVLVCCSCEITSSFFADAFETFLKNNRIQMLVDGGDLLSKQDCFQFYDLILLTPQIAYMESRFPVEQKDKLLQIPVSDYATSNFIHLFYLVAQKLETEA